MQICPIFLINKKRHIFLDRKQQKIGKLSRQLCKNIFFLRDGLKKNPMNIELNITKILTK